MRTRRSALIVAAVLIAVGLAACGGGGSSSPPTPSEVAAKIACSDYADDTTDELFVTAVGTCSIGSDDSVRVLVFNDNKGRDSFVTAAKSFGGSYAVGDRFAVEAESATIDEIDGKGAERA